MRLYLFLLLFITASTIVSAQPKSLKEYIDAAKDKSIRNEDLAKLYKLLDYKYAWLTEKNPGAIPALKEIIAEANLLYPNSNNFIIENISSTDNLKSSRDSFAYEINLTSTLMSAARVLFYGAQKPILGYDGLSYSPDCKDITDFVANCIQKNQLPEILSVSHKECPAAAIILERLKLLKGIVESPVFRETSVKSDKVSTANLPLITKLYLLGIIPTPTMHLTDSLLKEKVKEAQRMFCLLSDGVLRTTFLKELNVPINIRIAALRVSANNYKWLSCLQQSEVILVNIPSAEMNVYRSGNLILQMRMIVGKKATPTPTLTSKVDEVILYPYWHVPRSIFVKELLPAIKRNRAVLDAGNYQLINASGKVISPSVISWPSMNASYFPYTIRQSTGCDNSLGLLKLNFYSPFGVYLHDTSNPALFMAGQRFFSHGCMRMEKPFELGHLLMKNNSIAIDTLEQKGCIRNQAPVTIKTEVKMPVVVWYTPAGVSNDQQILFYPDVYDRLNAISNSKK